MLVACTPQSPPPSTGTSPEAIAEAQYTGGQPCVACHPAQAAAWTGSHHDLSMQTASPQAVRGDFSAARFSYNGITSEFFVRDGSYWVRTDGPDGAPTEYEITHTFGVEPLQQYLVRLSNGRFQALSTAWDTRPAAEGGQRWFHLYPEEAVDHTDPLHWTGVFQSWNTSCAECHSTNVRKNYAAEEDLFRTTFSSIDVDCEACHGPGSLHVQAPGESAYGLTSEEGRWLFPPGARIAQRVPEREGDLEIEVCAQCHARRTQLTDEHEPGDPLLDAFRPTLLELDLYHADGQIQGEVYVYGSFLQSRMYAAGVTCSDCHDPHTTEPRLAGNALCAQCHLASAYAGPEHHHHDRQGPGSDCVDCHMPATTYMVVDPRRDHSFRVPRPDLSAELGTPNACTGCHAEQSHRWAADTVAEWFPEGRSRTRHYGEAIHAARQWTADRGHLLRATVADPSAPAIVRATAVSHLSAQLDDDALATITGVLRGDEPLVELTALAALENLAPEARIDLGQRFLDHPLRALRVAAAHALLPARTELSDRRRNDLDAALREYWAAQQFNSDRATGLSNTGTTLARLGELASAYAALETAIEREPHFTAAYVNLADIYRTVGREQDARELLRAAIENHPEDPAGHFALGLSLVRSEERPAALEALDEAAALAPAEPYYHYVAALARNAPGEREAGLERLREVHERFPGHRETLVALATIHRDAAELDEAELYARRLLALAPGDGAARALLDELEATRP